MKIQGAERFADDPEKKQIPPPDKYYLPKVGAVKKRFCASYSVMKSNLPRFQIDPEKLKMVSPLEYKP